MQKNISPSQKSKILHRLKIARGHIDKVIKMVENDSYCIDIIHQSQAVQSALKHADHLTLENHLNTCVIEKIQQGKSKESIQEIMQVLQKTQK